MAVSENTTSQTAKPRRSLRRRLLFGLVFLVLVILVMELAVRLFWEPPMRFVGERLVHSGLFVPDEHLGWPNKTRPNRRTCSPPGPTSPRA